MRPSLSPHPFVVRPYPGRIDLELVRELRGRRARDSTGLYLAEGARFLHRAVRGHVAIAGVVICPYLLVGLAQREAVTRLQEAGVPLVKATRAEYASLTLGASAEGENSASRQGVMLVMHQRWEPLPSQFAAGECWIGVESIRVPGNLGTLLRSGEAAGASGLIVFDRSAEGSSNGPDPYDPSVVRATMGSIFAHRMIRTTHRQFRRWPGRAGVAVIGGAGEAECDYRALRYDRPTLLMLGDEGAGLSEAQRNTCDTLVRIPMAGALDSLNLAMAGTLMLYEVYHRHHPLKAG